MAISYAGIEIQSSPLPRTGRDASAAALREQSDRIVSDTEFSFSGSWEHRRLTDRRLCAFNNTESVASAGASALFRLEKARALTLVFRQEHDCPFRLSVDENAYGLTAAAGVFCCAVSDLSDGAHEVRVDAVGDGLILDAMYVTGGQADVYRILPDNSSFVYCPLGLRGGVLPAGDHLEVWFRGTFIRVCGTGSVTFLLDGQADTASLPLERTGLDEDMWHCLRMTAVSDTVPVCFEISDPVPFVTYANERTDRDIARMHEKQASGESDALPPDEWRPVTLRAKMPERDVTLRGGLLGSLFDRNIRYLKDCLRLPCFVTLKDQDRIWVDMLPASNDGRMLYGMGNTLRFREVKGFREAIDRILEPVERRQYTNYNGYCLPYESSNFALSTYSWPHFMRDEEKNYDRAMFTKGLIAAGMSGNGTAWTVLRGLYDWFNTCGYRDVLLLGAMGIQGSAAGPRVYFSPVGKPADILTNMDYYDMDWWLEALAQRIPEAIWRFTLNRPHNYLLTSLCALFDVYRATGQKKYLGAVLGGLDIYNNYFKLPGGVITVCEHFECRPETHFISNTPNNIFETCASVFMSELMARLLSVYPGSEAYAAQLEECVFNVLASCQGPDGQVRYFNHMNGVKYPAGRYNTCCEIQATGFFGELPGYLCQITDDGIWVNLYASSDVRFTVKGHEYVLTTGTDFPSSGRVTLTVHTDAPGCFDLHLRVPGWTTGKARASVNGEDIPCTPGSYLDLRRVWADGDTVTLSLPMPIRAVRYRGMHDIEGVERYALLRGPILMAVCGEGDKTLEQVPGEPVVSVRMTINQAMTSLVRNGRTAYTITGADGLTVKPYYAVKDDEYFSCFAAYAPEQAVSEEK